MRYCTHQELMRALEHTHRELMRALSKGHFKHAGNMHQDLMRALIIRIRNL
jgi:hypothetical protein